ncbi:hypothetical protein HDU93_001475 [Gonapodya sp. JEL0774]|nr:hypothetical protein HDU93_001475 [Gonapodya sp. JEL0774]
MTSHTPTKRGRTAARASKPSRVGQFNLRTSFVDYRAPSVGPDDEGNELRNVDSNQSDILERSGGGGAIVATASGVRHKGSRACDPCSKSKRKCDEKQPCRQCFARNFTCTYDRATRRGGARRGWAQDLREKVKQLEAVLASAAPSGAGVPPELSDPGSHPPTAQSQPSAGPECRVNVKSKTQHTQAEVPPTQPTSPTPSLTAFLESLEPLNSQLTMGALLKSPSPAPMLLPISVTTIPVPSAPQDTWPHSASPAPSPGRFSVSEFLAWPDGSGSERGDAREDTGSHGSPVAGGLSVGFDMRAPTPASWGRAIGSGGPGSPLGMGGIAAPGVSGHRPSFLANPTKDPLLLHALWAANIRLYATKYLLDPRDLVKTAEGIFERAMQMLVGRLQSAASVSTLTAILFLVAVARHMGPPHLAQRLMGFSLMMGRELGLGKEVHSHTFGEGEVSREMRRRLLWHLFMMERSFLPLAPALLTDAEAKRQYLPMADEVFNNLDQDDETTVSTSASAAANAALATVTKYGELGFSDITSFASSSPSGSRGSVGAKPKLSIDQRPASEIFEATNLILNGRMMDGGGAEKRMMQRLVERWWEQGSGFTIAPLILVNFRGHIAKLRRFAEEFDIEMWTALPGTTPVQSAPTEIAKRVSNFNVALKEYADSLPLPLKLINAAVDKGEITKVLRMLLGTGPAASSPPGSPENPNSFAFGRSPEAGGPELFGGEGHASSKHKRRNSVRGFGTGVVDKATLALLEFHSLRLLLNLPRSVNAMFEDKSWMGSESFIIEAVRQMSVIVEALAGLVEWQPTIAYIFEEQTAFDDAVDSSREQAPAPNSGSSLELTSGLGASQSESSSWMPTAQWARGVLPSLSEFMGSQNDNDMDQGDFGDNSTDNRGTAGELRSESPFAAVDSIGREPLVFGGSLTLGNNLNPAKNLVNGMISTMKRTKRRFNEAVASKSDIGKLWSIKFWSKTFLFSHPYRACMARKNQSDEDPELDAFVEESSPVPRFPVPIPIRFSDLPNRPPPPIPPPPAIPPDALAKLAIIRNEIDGLVRRNLDSVLALPMLELSPSGDVLPTTANKSYLLLVDALERFLLRLDEIVGNEIVRSKRRELINHVNRLLLVLDEKRVSVARSEVEKLVQVGVFEEELSISAALTPSTPRPNLADHNQDLGPLEVFKMLSEHPKLIQRERELAARLKESEDLVKILLKS